MGALWIAHVTVTDAEAYGKYAELAGPAIAKHGGSFIARGGKFVQCVKYACELDGLPAGKAVRLPLRPMKKELKRQMRDAVITARRTIRGILAAEEEAPA